MLRFLLASMKKRHAWDRIKCAIATGIPVFWVLLIVTRPLFPAAPSAASPAGIMAAVQPLLEQTPAIWTIAVSLAVAGFQWYNLVQYQRKVIPLVREMYERALARRDSQLFVMLREALRFRTLRESLRNAWRSLFREGP